jgi:aspartate/glutamate racemase
MSNNITGGYWSYGHMAGILMSDSTIPRIPGDPGHAETFPFPVLHEVLHDFPFQDLIDISKDHIGILIACAKKLEQRGVSLVAADCGLFGPFQEELRNQLKVPFIGSALDLIPLLQRHLPAGQRIGIITGHTGILKPAHLEASGVDPKSVVVTGMENSKEFDRVVIQRAQTLDPEAMRKGVLDAAEALKGQNPGAIVLECTNLISFRLDIQNRLKKPVYDLVSLIEFYVSGFAKRVFDSRFIR